MIQLPPPGAPLPHSASDAPFDPVADQEGDGGKLAHASQLRVMWWKFRRHRLALNFFVSDIGSLLPAIVSGAEITAIVLSLETTGPLLIRALQSQDMYLAGSFLMFLAFLTVIGVLVSDIALALLDPRIRLAGKATK